MHFSLNPRSDAITTYMERNERRENFLRLKPTMAAARVNLLKRINDDIKWETQETEKTIKEEFSILQFSFLHWAFL